jgi:peptidoglycan glycosyltransferase
VVMTPHVMSSISDSQGANVESYTPKAMPRAASTTAAQSVAALMESVPISGTADHVGFPPYLCAAVKTGTAQTSTAVGVNHDWMIGFAPANNPQIAVAVVVPDQNISSDGAGVAGPIMRAVMEAALPQSQVTQPCTVTAPPLSAYGPQAPNT